MCKVISTPAEFLSVGGLVVFVPFVLLCPDGAHIKCSFARTKNPTDSASPTPLYLALIYDIFFCNKSQRGEGIH